MFRPDSVKIKTYRSPLVINTIKVNEKLPLIDLNKDTLIYLKHFQNYIDIEFTLLDFRNPLSNTYSYMLEGVDKTPVEAVSRNFASYTDLKPGSYLFKLEGMGPGTNSEKSTLNIAFEISPAYWETHLAYLIYVILGLCLLFGIYKIATTRANYIYRLDEAKKAIQQNMEINETKLRFFTNISHELQSPLALICVPAENLSQSANLNQEEKKFVELIQNNAYRLIHLIQQLMYFRKTQYDVMKLNAMKGDLIGFLKEITQPFMVFAQKHHISFKLTHTEEVLVMRFDPDKIEKIINNLLMNAFKFTSQGGHVEIHVSTGEYNILGRGSIIKRKKEVGQMVKISVTDTGIGMSKTELKNIFNRFYMGKNSGEYIGTGIGLELTKTLVEMHGGTIDVESKENEGSTFTISLFRDENYLKTSNISDEEIIVKKYVSEFDYSKLLDDTFKDGEPVNLEANSPNKPLLLIVEDNNDLRKFLGENLAGHYNVLLAENGKKGLDMATEKIPDLIVSDVMMPEMDGVEMCERIKSNVLTSHIPVILLTHKTLIKDKIAGLKTGADDYVEKPFNMQYLLLRINNIFKSIQKVREQIIKELGIGKVESPGISVYDNKLLNKCKEAVDQNLSNTEFSVEELSKIVGMSRSQLYRKITALTGQSPADFIYASRLQQAKKLLIEEKYSVMDVAHLTGFSSSNSFSQVFKKHFGMSPKEYAEKYAS
jgi:signal transduction histidine kinase/DNA-binding response OmpR family regulator